MWHRSLAAWGLAVAAVVVAAQPPPGPRDLPTNSELVRALEARWHSTGVLSALIGRITFDHDTRDPDAVRIVLVQVSSDYLLWKPERTVYQSHFCGLSPDPTVLPSDEQWLFVVEDFERSYHSRISRLSRVTQRRIRVDNTIQPPGSTGAGLASVLGLGSGYRPIGESFEPDWTIEDREEVDGHDCIRVRDGDRMWWFAEDLGYAPVRRLSEVVAESGTPHRSESRWLRFEAAAGEPDVLVATRYYTIAERFAPTADGGEARWLPNVLVMWSAASVAINTVPELPWPEELPLLVGGTFNNRVTGLPADRQTIGYSLEQLRREAYETPTPFGIDFPPLREQRERELAAAAEAE